MCQFYRIGFWNLNHFTPFRDTLIMERISVHISNLFKTKKHGHGECYR